MVRSILRALRRPASAGAIATVLVIATTLATVPAGAVGTCDSNQMPDVMPTADMQQGETGTAYTVVQGTQQSSFAVEVLGVEHDVILPGHAFVLVRLSGPVIDSTNGIAAGMSGSPVYDDNTGKLMGALAYGIYGDDHLAGMTPAEEMVQIFNDPEHSSAARAPARVKLSPSLRHIVARQEGTSYAHSPATASVLPTPLAVSGLSGRGMQRFKKLIRRLKLHVIPFSAQATSVGQPLSQTPLEPGDSYAAVISTGDITAGGIGTETATCGDLSVGWGHYFGFEGPTTFGLHGANVVTVVADQSHQYSYKWADITEPHGTVDQDRFSAIRGIDGVYPVAVPVTSDVNNVDLGTSRSGETDILRQDFVPDFAAYHLMYNMYTVFDRAGPGTDTITFTIDGKHEDGTPWTLSRTDMNYATFDAAYEGVFGMLNDLYSIAFNPFEKVTFTGIQTSADMTQEQLTSDVKKVQWATRQSPVFSSRRVIPAKPGSRIKLQVTLLPHGSTTPEVVSFSVRVPSNIQGSGELSVAGGGQQGGFYFGSGSSAAPSRAAVARAFGVHDGGPKTFDELLAQLSNAPHQNDIIAQLLAPGIDTAAGEGRVLRHQSRIVFGERDFAVVIQGGGGGSCVPGKPCGVGPR